MNAPRPDEQDHPAAVAQATPRPSKTQSKKAMHELQDLGEALVALPADRIAGLPLSETLR